MGWLKNIIPIITKLKKKRKNNMFWGFNLTGRIIKVKRSAEGIWGNPQISRLTFINRNKLGCLTGR